MSSGAQITQEVVKRDGRSVPFDEGRIKRAVTKAFEADGQFPDDSPSLTEAARIVARRVANNFEDRDQIIPVEQIQDQVEIALMACGYYSVARRYILYRDGRAKARDLHTPEETQSRLSVLDSAGDKTELSMSRIRLCVKFACRGLKDVSLDDLLEEVSASLYDGMTVSEIEQSIILAARSRVEREPQYDTVAVRLLLMQIERQALGKAVMSDDDSERDFHHRVHFKDYLHAGVDSGQLDPRMLDFDLHLIVRALQPTRDFKFKYLGLQTVYDRYLKELDGRRIETPQYFWMRVAMGLSLDEENKEFWAGRFYEMLSTFRFVSGTPTLFNAGTNHPQLSSCYLLQVDDALEHILKINSDHGKLSKWAGGLGTSVTKIRGTNAMIKSTRGPSQGVIPFIKMYDSTTIAVNQGGKRKGALCLYLEPWHLDLEDFMDLRRNTGDDRRRAHDTHTALWIPDLFMKRIKEKGVWTLFSPDETPDLCDAYGKDFEERYTRYEAMAEDGKIKLSRQVSAVELWRKIISRLFETGHPWVTFKDPSNIRSPQSHVGVVHNSNLCTEITLNTSKEETAVCNLGSVNWDEHLMEETRDYQTAAMETPQQMVIAVHIDEQKLEETVNVAIRMLDNVINLNFYPIPEARVSNMQHRPIGLGQMGFQDMLMRMSIPYASEAAVTLADYSTELYSYYAIQASSDLARERGTYESYPGSKWAQGILPCDSLDLLEENRGEPIQVSRGSQKDWSIVRESVARYGMRNSNVMAIAPTATIGFIAGVTASIEPFFKHLFVKSNLSGEFTCVNLYLVEELKRLGLWGQDILDQIKYHDGSILQIEEIPEEIRATYLTAFEIDPSWLIRCAARRQKWIDQAQSLNLYTEGTSGKKLSDMYFEAWETGLKTTYYLRTRSATQVEKSTLDVNKYGIQPSWMQNKSASSDVVIDRGEVEGKTCRIDDPDCEACQ